MLGPGTVRCTFPAVQRSARSARSGKSGGRGGGAGAATAMVRQEAARARSRWLLAVTLINNPALRSCRKSVVVEAARSQRALMGGLATDVSAQQDSWVRARIKHTVAQQRQRVATSAVPAPHPSASSSDDATAKAVQKLDHTASSHSNSKSAAGWNEEIVL